MIGLFFGGKEFQNKFGNEYGNVELDAVLDEAHEWSVEATSNPVEEGSPITDHIIEQADKIKIRGFVSDTPLGIKKILERLTQGKSDPRTQETFTLLYELIKLKQLMTVYTKYRIYDNMLLQSVSIPRAAGQGEAIEFTAEFINIRIVSTQMVDTPDGINPKKTAKSDASTGRKTEPPKNGGTKQVEKLSSTLSRTLAGVFK